MLKVIAGGVGSSQEGASSWSPIDEIVREGARQMLAAALQAEVAAYIAQYVELIEAAQNRWRAVSAPHLVALVRAGACFERGVLIEREQAPAA